MSAVPAVRCYGEPAPLARRESECRVVRSTKYAQRPSTLNTYRGDDSIWLPSLPSLSISRRGGGRPLRAAPERAERRPGLRQRRRRADAGWLALSEVVPITAPTAVAAAAAAAAAARVARYAHFFPSAAPVIAPVTASRRKLVPFAHNALSLGRGYVFAFLLSLGRGYVFAFLWCSTSKHARHAEAPVWLREPLWLRRLGGRRRQRRRAVGRLIGGVCRRSRRCALGRGERRDGRRRGSPSATAVCAEISDVISDTISEIPTSDQARARAGLGRLPRQRRRGRQLGSGLWRPRRLHLCLARRHQFVAWAVRRGSARPMRRGALAVWAVRRGAWAVRAAVRAAVRVAVRAAVRRGAFVWRRR